MDLKVATDEALLLGIQQQDIGALEELYDRYHRIALAVAYRVLRSKEWAEDAVQEAFLGVWRRPSTFNPEKGAATKLRLWRNSSKSWKPWWKGLGSGLSGPCSKTLKTLAAQWCNIVEATLCCCSLRACHCCLQTEPIRCGA